MLFVACEFQWKLCEFQKKVQEDLWKEKKWLDDVARKKGDKNQGEFVWIPFSLPGRLHARVQSASERLLFIKDWRCWRPNASGWFSLPFFVGVLRSRTRGPSLSQGARCRFFNVDRSCQPQSQHRSSNQGFYFNLSEKERKKWVPSLLGWWKLHDGWRSRCSPLGHVTPSNLRTPQAVAACSNLLLLFLYHFPFPLST